MNNLVEKAKEIATLHHAGQVRKVSKKEYIVHPTEVAQYLKKAGFDEHVQAAGYLHDTKEDTEISNEELLQTFSEKTLKLIDAVTEQKKDAMTGEKIDWTTRKKGVMDKIEKGTLEEKAIYVADKLSNLRSLKEDLEILGDEKLWSIFKEPLEKQAWSFFKGVEVAKAGLDFDQMTDEQKSLFETFEKETNEFFEPYFSYNLDDLDFGSIKTKEDALVLLNEHSSDSATYALRSAQLSYAIAKEAGLNEEQCQLAFDATVYHDIGKLGMPKELINYPDKYTNHMFDQMKHHAIGGAEILEKVGAEPEIVEACRFHHRNYDGFGYGGQAKGKEIPELARIVRISDSVDAYMTNRVYKAGQKASGAYEDLTNPKFVNGYDPDLLDAYKIVHDKTMESCLSKGIDSPSQEQYMNSMVELYQKEKSLEQNIHSPSNYFNDIIENSSQDPIDIKRKIISNAKENDKDISKILINLKDSKKEKKNEVTKNLNL